MAARTVDSRAEKGKRGRVTGPALSPGPRSAPALLFRGGWRRGTLRAPESRDPAPPRPPAPLPSPPPAALAPPTDPARPGPARTTGRRPRRGNPPAPVQAPRAE